MPALPVKEGGPLLQLPECQPPPQPVQDSVPGLVLPEGSVITNVERHPLTTVHGYVPVTPVNVRIFYATQQDELDFSELEDEIYEAEALYTLGVHNAYVKAQATCATGSQLIAVVDRPGRTPRCPRWVAGATDPPPDQSILRTRACIVGRWASAARSARCTPSSR